MDKKISIVLPIYNVEKYITKCLDSLINQTFKNLEILSIIDETDTSYSILQDYAKVDDRIKIIIQKNGGLSSARNEGIKNATGEYICFVDPDDWIELNTYELAYNAITNNDADFVQWYANIICEDFSEDDPRILAQKEYHKIRDKGFKELTDEIVAFMNVTVWNKLFKTGIIKENNLNFPLNYHYEDQEFFTKYALHCKAAFFIDKYLYNYIQRQDSELSKMYSDTKNNSIEYLNIFENIFKYYEEKNAIENHKFLLNMKFEEYCFSAYRFYPPKDILTKRFQELIIRLDLQRLGNNNIDLIMQNKPHYIKGYLGSAFQWYGLGCQ